MYDYSRTEMIPAPQNHWRFCCLLHNNDLVFEMPFGIVMTREILAKQFHAKLHSVFGRGTDEEHALQVSHSQTAKHGAAVEQS